MSKDGLTVEVPTDIEVENLLLGFIDSLVADQMKHRAQITPVHSPDVLDLPITDQVIQS